MHRHPSSSSSSSPRVKLSYIYTDPSSSPPHSPSISFLFPYHRSFGILFFSFPFSLRFFLSHLISSVFSPFSYIFSFASFFSYSIPLIISRSPSFLILHAYEFLSFPLLLFSYSLPIALSSSLSSPLHPHFPPLSSPFLHPSPT